MAVRENEALNERVLGLLKGIAEARDRPVDAGCELSAIGFDSLACAEFAAAAERELGVDLVDGRVMSVKTAGELAELVERAVGRDRLARERYPRGMGRMQQAARAI